MRTKPTPGLVLAIFVAYGIYLIITFALSGVDYDQIGDSTENVLRAVVVPVGIGSALLALLTGRLRWWEAAIRERSPAGPRWLLVVPGLMLLIAVLNLVDNGVGDNSFGFLVVLAIGVCFVGFSEELLTRGLMLVGFRGSLSETWVWFLTSLLFGVLHGINIIAGQAVDDTLQQIGFAFAFGSVLYLTRRVAGTLIVCMVIHATWDFSVFAVESGSTVTTTDTAPGIGQLFMIPLILVSIFGLVRVLRRPQSGHRQATVGE
ncbi:MAG: CPBP family intramembrane metalloprotease [Solirubrobacterales bacterium]|nr:CPBP family intramembrane metalloprotease [Solirubrobacterales bacterium]